MSNRRTKDCVTAGIAVLVLGWLGCKNLPPDRPSPPDGPNAGRVGIACRFTATATDPDGNLVALRFDWDNGDTSDWTTLFRSGDTASAQYAWPLPGNYKVSVQARDEKGLVSMWSNWHEIAIADTVNLPPSIPEIPSGPDTCLVDSLAEFSTAGADPNADRISYQFDWGDGDTSLWSALVGGGTRVKMLHAWTTAGEYMLRARARDEKGLLSDWSNVHFLTVLDSLP